MKNACNTMQEMVDSGKYVETTGKNRGPAVDALNKEFGLALGSSWCALIVCKAFKMIEKEFPQAPGIKILKTASSQALLKWFKSKGLTSANPQDILEWKGALAIRTDPDQIHGHVTLIKNRFTTTEGLLAAIGTLEGNTDKNGGSNGDGAYERKRKIPLSPYKWTFCDTSSLIGGQWWNK